MVILNKFCFCIDLKKGAIIIAAVHIVGSLLNGFGTIYMVADRNRDNFLIGYTIIMAIMSFASAALLIYGTNKNKPKLLIPWLILVAIMAVFDFILIIKGLILVAKLANWDENAAGKKISIPILFIIILFIHIYVWICVFSLHQKMKQHRRSTAEEGENLSFNYPDQPVQPLMMLQPLQPLQPLHDMRTNTNNVQYSPMIGFAMNYSTQPPENPPYPIYPPTYKQ